MQNSKKLSLSKIKKLLVLFKYIIVQKSGNKNTVLRYLNDESINDISESIHNLLYNEKLNSLFSRLQKTKLKRIIKHNVKSFEDISRKKVPIIKRRKKNYSTRKRNWYNSFNINPYSFIFSCKEIIDNVKAFNKRG